MAASRQSKILFYFSILLGLFHTWGYRFEMNPDGISYIDIAYAYMERDWSNAINAYWSPAYSWILAIFFMIFSPSPAWEFPVVHLANFAIFLFSLWTFRFCLTRFIEWKQSDEWVWILLGHVLFLWTALDLISLHTVTPDLFVAGLLFALVGLLIQMEMQHARPKDFVIFGVLLALAYLSKAVMLYIGFLLWLISVYLVRKRRQPLVECLISLGVFVILTAPFIVSISMQKGRPTLGETGRIVYVWNAKEVPLKMHWQGSEDTGTPTHTTRQIFESPRVFEFATPIAGTSPPWYDPSYWNEGMRPQFNWQEQKEILKKSTSTFLHLIFPEQLPLILAWILLLILAQKPQSLKIFLSHLWFFLPGLAAFTLYYLVYLEARYIGAYFLLFWLGLFGIFKLPEEEGRQEVCAHMMSVVSMIMLIFVLLESITPFYRTARPIFGGDIAHLRHAAADMAEEVNDLGLRDGDSIGYLGASHKAYWPRLARLQVITEMHEQDVEGFFKQSVSTQQWVLDQMLATGAKIIFAENVPKSMKDMGWKRVGDTALCYYQT